MPSWNEILLEASTPLTDFDSVRRKYLKRLSDYTGRNTICYYSGWQQKPGLALDYNVEFGISDSDKDAFMATVHDLERPKGLDLLLHTPGGDLAATESIVDYLRLMFGGNVRAIIPQMAMSGGTIIALGCKEIVMGKGSSIGPIDPQVRGVSVRALLDEIDNIREEIEENPSSSLLWQPILQQLHPGELTQYEKMIEWSREMAERFLSRNMIPESPNSAERIKHIIDSLTETSKTKSHGRHISITEAQEIFGDCIVPLEDDQLLQDAVLSAHHAIGITLDATAAYKVVENQEGRAFIRHTNTARNP